jgi:hypothetical protein
MPTDSRNDFSIKIPMDINEIKFDYKTLIIDDNETIEK